MGIYRTYTITLLVSGLTQLSILHAETRLPHQSIAAQRPADAAADAVEASIETTADPNAPIEIVQERYADGTVKIRREVTLDTVGNYILHGDWTMYTPSGEEFARGRFQNNKREGEWTRTYGRSDAAMFSEEFYLDFTEPFTSVATFKDGRLDGTWTIYDAEERVASEWEYTDGKRNGVRRWNYPSGEVRQEVTYKDGLIDGKHRRWDEENQLTVDNTYQMGRKLAMRVEHFANGQKKSEGMYLHEKLVPKVLENWWTADTGSYTRVGEIERHGRNISWHENGQKKSEETFDHEKPVGEFSSWHPNSQIAVTGQYDDDGEREGLWVWWHANGQKATQGTYNDGELSGKWSYWTKTGILQHRIDYSGESERVEVQADSDDASDEQVGVAGRNAYSR